MAKKSKQSLQRRNDLPHNLYGNLKTAAAFLTGMWTFAILTVLPLYVQNKYREIGVCKFRVFEWSSRLFILPAAVILIVLGIWKYRFSLRKMVKDFSSMDWWVLAYAAANILSWCFSQYKEEAWSGVNGWFMGLRTQLFMTTAYFCISRVLPFKKAILYGHFIGSSLTFLFGVLHRFLIDPLGMYKGIDEIYFLQFLSTIGQATWFSSYVCVVFPIGLIFYFRCRKKKQQMALGAYCMLGFMTVVTQNSDSAFMAMIFVLTGLFWLACQSNDKMERFLQIVIMMLLSFKIVGILQWVFSGRAVRLDALSAFLAQSTWTWVVLIAVLVIYIGFLSVQQKKEAAKIPFSDTVRFGKQLRVIVPASLAAGLLGAAVFIVLNTKGVLFRLFGFQSQNSYLLFDENWGSNRGFTWSFAGNVIWDMPVKSRLFGVGPDCFFPYCYSRSDYSGQLRDFWRGQNLTNAHNEFLNLLICIGIVGLLAFLGMLVCAVIRYLKRSHLHPLAAAGAIAVLAYAGHNFFCYQQVCCTPFLFLILGAAENVVRKKRDCKDSCFE